MNKIVKDLIYVVPKTYNPIQSDRYDVSIPSYNRYLSSVLGSLNKINNDGMTVDGYVMDFYGHDYRHFATNVRARCYLIDLQNPFCLRDGMQIIRYLRYYQDSGHVRIFVVGEFALKVKDCLKGVDFILPNLIEERLLFLCRKGIKTDNQLFPKCENKLELDNYDYVSLDTLIDSSKVKRNLNPFFVTLHKDVYDSNDNITPISKTKIGKIIKQLEKQKIKTIGITEFNTELLNIPITPLSLVIDIPIEKLDKVYIEYLNQAFQKVDVNVYVKNSEVLEEKLDDLKEVFDFKNVKITACVKKTIIYPYLTEYLTELQVTTIHDILSTIKQGRKAVKIVDVDYITDWSDWNTNQSIIRQLTKRFEN